MFERDPHELVHNDWLQAIVQESKYLTSVTAEHFKMSAEVASSASTAANRRFVNVEAGELVLVQKPFYEKGQGMVLPQNDGPFVVDLVFNDHAVRLRDVLSGDPVFNGRRVATSRLVRFPFPPEWAQHDLREDVDAHVTFKVGDMVVVEHALGNNKRCSVARVERVFNTGAQAEVKLFEVALGDRFGPWTRRKWMPVDGPYEVVAFVDIVCAAELEHSALSARTLELLAAAGVPLHIAKSKSLPQRVLAE